MNKHWKVEFLLLEARAAATQGMRDAWYQLAAEWMVSGTMNVTSATDHQRRTISEEDERAWYQNCHLATISRLKNELASMDNASWEQNTADGARVCAALLFPGWSPRLAKLDYILDLTRMLYAPQSPEVREATEERDAEKVALRADRSINLWPEARQQSAFLSFLRVAKRAGL